MLSSSAGRWVRVVARLLKEVLFAIAFSLINPIVIAVNFVFVFDKLAASVGANTLAMPGYLIPVYMLAGIGIYAVIASMLFLAARVALRLSFSRFSSVNALAHLAFAPFLLFSAQLIWGGMEWNVMGFIIVPLFLFVGLLTIPGYIAIALLRINKQRHKN